MGSVGRSVTTPQQNALFFRDGQAYGGSPMQAHGLSRATNPKKGVSPSPMNYKPLGFTAQEAGYFGPGRYGAAKRYGEDSVTNPNVPFTGNYYPGGTVKNTIGSQLRSQVQQAPTVFLDDMKRKGRPAKAPMPAGIHGGLY
jgi:hypothetical protein